MSVPSRFPVLQTICSIWIIGFLIFFFSETHSNDQEFSRAFIWQQIWKNVFFVLPALLNPFDVSHVSVTGFDSGWPMLIQRWPFFRIAGLLFLSVITTGVAIARPLLRSTRLTRCECFVIQVGLGLSFQSLWTLIIGSAGCLSFATVLAPGSVSFLLIINSVLRRRFRKTNAWQTLSARSSPEPAPRWLWVTTGLFVLPFLILLLLNGFTPPWEFDVCEYHLQGPKEWFQAGEIMFLEHNVYTSFPFLSEMLSLDTMVLADDWGDGAVSAKVVLAGFQLLTALCVFTTARRWFGTSAGLVAAIVYISVPWTLRISLIAYAEGAVTFFLMATILCGLIASRESEASIQRRLILVTGIMAGSAMAAKYPAVVSVVIPAGLLLLCSVQTKGRLQLSIALLYGAGVLLAAGPWLVRNIVDTGNPVYPLMYSVFGAEDWSPAMDDKWKNAHTASEHSAVKIPHHLMAILVFSKWTSGLLFGLAVPTLLLLRKHHQARYLWAMVAWLLITWWALTHRIDRFWIPIIPVSALLAGASWTLFQNTCWRVLLIICVAGCSLFNLQLWRMPEITGFQCGLMDFQVLRSLVVRGDFKTLNSRLSSEDRILMIGEAEVFDLRIPVYYNTVFDESLFEQWTADESDGRHWSPERKMKSADAVLQVFAEKGVTYVYVNWLEILRYRRKGSYGYTDYVMPRRLKQLTDLGVLSDPTVLARRSWEDLSEQDQALISQWPGYEDLLTNGSAGGKKRWGPIRLYRVRETYGKPAAKL